jgi:hypothetical protein
LLIVSLGWTPGAPLAGLRGVDPGFAAWLAPDGTAARAVREALAGAGAPSRGAAPLFAPGPGPVPCEGLDAATAAGLAAGSVDVVVTGQQPGFLGGPLLTLLKIAATVALAAERTAAGRPCVPVFWCGDDDDDLVEALDPVAWDAPNNLLVRADGRAAARSGRFERAMIGLLPARRWCGPGAAVLRSLAAGDRPGALAADLALLWEQALAEDWDWSRLNVTAMRRIFAGHPLLVVRGNDPALQAAAGPFYATVTARRPHCRELARREGERMAGAAPISERSLGRDLFAAVDGRRVFVPDGSPLPDAASLRPGVLLRSLVQDWLLQPAAVVVGPGEAAYLAQLLPLYAELGVPRAPLVPRLFGWVLPEGFPAGRLEVLAAGPRFDRADAEARSAQLAGDAAAGVARVLEHDLGLPAVRAAALAEGRARRWRRGVAAMLKAEGARQWQQELSGLPPWILPDGQRQERRLAACATAALYGDALVEALVGAARAHLLAGAGGDWREYHVK